MNGEVSILRRHGFMVGIAPKFPPEIAPSLVAALPEAKLRAQTVLGGRAAVSNVDVSGLGPVVIKQYRRGGALGPFLRGRYLRFGKTRPQREYEVLTVVRGWGVNAPEPVAFLVRGWVFYRGWLVTREISDQASLADISLRDENRAGRAVKRLTEQIATLIEHRIFHVDLHPGNVLVDRQDQVYLLDFDKACRWRGTLSALRDRYICRWRRAVIKHRLPESLSEWLCAGLRRSYE